MRKKEYCCIGKMWSQLLVQELFCANHGFEVNNEVLYDVLFFSLELKVRVILNSAVGCFPASYLLTSYEHYYYVHKLK